MTLFLKCHCFDYNMRTVFLGTSSMVPTKRRNVSGVFCEHHGDCYLLDCGEGTQRQMNIAGLNRHRVNTVLLTHWHGDHVSGLVGLLQTKEKIPDPDPVTVVGPKGTKERMHHLLRSAVFNVSYEISVVEVDQGSKIIRNDSTVVTVDQVDHGIPCVAYRIMERKKRRVRMDALRDQGVPEGPHIGDLQRGESIEYDGEVYDVDTYTYVPDQIGVSYVVDTSPCQGADRIAREADVLICEATFDEANKERANSYNHMTAKDAARIAQRAGVDRLYLTHFSQRFRDVTPLVEEAKDIFGETRAAHDFLEVKIPFVDEDEAL